MSRHQFGKKLKGKYSRQGTVYPNAQRQQRTQVFEGMRVVSMWVDWVREGLWCEKNKTNHLRCCQEGGETQPIWKAWGTTEKDRALLLL